MASLGGLIAACSSRGVCRILSKRFGWKVCFAMP
jgi:hypothetical protein